MLASFAIIISLLCMVLMFTILVRFKKLFSTESIIEKTKIQMNKIISDINNNANRDIELINSSSRRLRELLKNSEEEMKNLKEATNLLRNMIANVEQNKKEENSITTLRYFDEEELKPKIDPNASYTVNTENDFLRDETKVTTDGTAYKEVPLIITKVYDGKLNQVPKIKSEVQNNSLADKVERFFTQGYSAEEIAEKLSCSISEVQFIIDMNFS